MGKIVTKKIQKSPNLDTLVMNKPLQQIKWSHFQNIHECSPQYYYRHKFKKKFSATIGRNVGWYFQGQKCSFSPFSLLSSCCPLPTTESLLQLNSFFLLLLLRTLMLHYLPPYLVCVCVIMMMMMSDRKCWSNSNRVHLISANLVNNFFFFFLPFFTDIIFIFFETQFRFLADSRNECESR